MKMQYERTSIDNQKSNKRDTYLRNSKRLKQKGPDAVFLSLKLVYIRHSTDYRPIKNTGGDPQNTAKTAMNRKEGQNQRR